MSRDSCEEAVTQVYLFLDGETTWFRKTRIKRHLRRCHGCLHAYDFESRLKSIVREHAREEPHPEVIDRLRAFLAEHEPGLFGKGP